MPQKRMFFERCVSSHAMQVELQLLNASFVDAAEIYSYPPHKHVSCEVVAPLKGRYECKINGEPFTLDEGSLLLIQPSDFHEDFYSADSKLLFLTYMFYDFAGRGWEHGILSPDAPASLRKASLSASGKLGALFSHFMDESIDIEARCCLGEALLWQFIGAFPQSSLHPEYLLLMERSAFSRKIGNYFQENIAKRLDAKQMAEAFGLSKRTLEYKCMKYLRESPAHAFLACKMRTAAQLLEMGKDVKDVAQRLGFSSQFYFSTAFKRLIGYPPSKTETGLGKGSHLRKIESILH